jgi:undecaprenyl-diphosphatase
VDPWQGLVLGVVQGLTEFLPISSSGHLILVPWLLGWPEHTLTFDVALHMGTLAALLIYFWRDIWLMVAAWLPQRHVAFGVVQGAAGAAMAADDEERQRLRRLGLGIVVASIPAAVVGALFSDRIEATLRSPVLVALLMIAGGVLLGAADRAGVKRIELESLRLPQALAIGLAQCLALAPGVSRSGITLSAALFLGMTREAAARYVFLLGIPVTAGAGVFQLRHLFQDGIPADERAAFALGVFSSLVVGLLAIRFLLTYLRRHSLDIFVAYRFLVALLVLAVAALRAR